MKRKVAKKVMEKAVNTPKPIVVAANGDIVREQFVTPAQVGHFERMGYKVTELNDNSGFSVPVSVKDTYLTAVKAGRAVYMTK